MEIAPEDIMLNHINNNNNNGGGELCMPGFRFHPTEEELVGFYLKKMVEGKRFDINIIKTLDLYQYDPWHLPGLARVGEREWYFFVPRDKKYPNGGRPNRITASGYWKATGSDKQVRNEALRCIGLKKTLVFYTGRAPRGQKTDWVMNEYRMPDFNIQKPKKQMVLCRIYRKATSLKWLEQRAMGEELATEETRGVAERLSWDSIAVHDSLDLHMTESDACSLTKCDVNYQAAYEDSEISDLVGFQSLKDDGSSCSLPGAGAAANSDATYIGCGHVATDIKPAKAKPPQLELPKLRGDVFSELSASQLHSLQRSPLADIWTPSALLCTPQGFNLWGHTNAIGSDIFDQPCSF